MDEDEGSYVCQVEHEKTPAGESLWVWHTFKNDLEEATKISSYKILQLIKAGTNPKSLRITLNSKTIFSTTWDMKKAE